VFLNKQHFHTNFFYKTIYNKIFESNFNLIFPLIGLSLGSIFSGYLLQDLFVGSGSEFFKYSLYILPKNELFSQVEHTHFFFKQLPIFFSLLGYFILLNFFFILNKYNNIFFFRRFYILFINKFYFDEIYNIFNIFLFFPIGKFLILSLDNGFLELFGPRGIFKVLLIISFNFNLYLDNFLFNYIHIYIFFI